MASTEESGPAVTTVTVEETQAAEVNGDLIEQTLGKYRLVRHLATGGMAEIYLAEQAGPEGFAKEIVIKRILPHLAKDAQFTDMFLDEARLASNLNHPNIGQILELGQHGTHYFIAMEFIDGASLDELIEGDSGVPPDVAARIIADTLQALDFAHESKDRDGRPLNIVHRDVTPSNVMVSIDGIVKLVDFGVAKAAKKNHKTQTGAVKGKFAYMAPEQIETSDIDRRADIFAIGIVFYELLTGVKPFGEELAAVSRILHEDPKDPREIRAEIPDPYVQIIRRALRKSPQERYPTAHTMLLDIETALRMRNSYVGPREISYVIRKFRGLTLPAGVDLSVTDTGVFAADRSAELSTDSSRELKTAATALAEDESGDEVETAAKRDAKPARTAPGATLTLAIPSIPRRAIAIGAGAVLAVAVVAVAASAISNRESPSPLVGQEAKLVVLNATPLVEEGAEPDALYDEGGRPILIDTIPSTKIFKGSTFIGSAPLQTKLRPGKHRIELVLGDERKTATIDVDDSDEFQRRLLFFDSVGERVAEPETKRKKRRGAGSRFKAKIRSLF